MAHKIEIKGNKFHITDTTSSSYFYEGKNVSTVEADFSGGKWYIIARQEKVFNPSGYLFSELVDENDNAFADDAAVADWFAQNT